MDSCQCPRSINGYYQYACCQGKCRACKNIDLPQINALTTDVLRTFYQFEITKTKYQCKKTGIEKLSLMTERVEHKESIKDIYGRLVKMKHSYLKHRYQVTNDKFEWQNILNTSNDYGTIFHLDYSENLCGTPKYEPQ